MTMADGRIDLEEARSTARVPVDGRHRRSAQSRQRIQDALIALLHEGETRPSADQLAERAGVGRRTVFRLFSDMESIYASLHAEMRAALHRGGAPDSDGPPEALDDMVRRRVRLLEDWLPLHRASAPHRHEGGAVARAARALDQDLRRDVARALPAEGEEDPLLLEGLDALLSPDMWSRLRHDRKLDRETAQQVLLRVAEALDA